LILTVHNCTFSLGPEKRGMAKLDSAINQLDAYFYREQNRGTFNELDALILALKRKIVQLGSHGRDAETLPLSRLIIERLDDYEQHPEKYKDGSHREPDTSQKRADYINFYRGQAQNYITAAYVSLGEAICLWNKEGHKGRQKLYHLSLFKWYCRGIRQQNKRGFILYCSHLIVNLQAERQ